MLTLFSICKLSERMYVVLGGVYSIILVLVFIIILWYVVLSQWLLEFEIIREALQLKNELPASPYIPSSSLPPSPTSSPSPPTSQTTLKNRLLVTLDQVEGDEWIKLPITIKGGPHRYTLTFEKHPNLTSILSTKKSLLATLCQAIPLPWTFSSNRECVFPFQVEAGDPTVYHHLSYRWQLTEEE